MLPANDSPALYAGASKKLITICVVVLAVRVTAGRSAVSEVIPPYVIDALSDMVVVLAEPVLLRLTAHTKASVPLLPAQLTAITDT